jgi:hypothetical protein
MVENRGKILRGPRESLYRATIAIRTHFRNDVNKMMSRHPSQGSIRRRLFFDASVMPFSPGGKQTVEVFPAGGRVFPGHLVANP